MNVEVRFFAGAREAASQESLQLTLRDGARVGDLRRELLTAAPALARYGRSLWIAVNGEYAADGDAIPAKAEVACFPPVSGG